MPPGEAAGNSQRLIRISQENQFTSALDICIEPQPGRMRPPAELLLIDPAGRRLGKDPRTKSEYKEVPDAYYGYEYVDDEAGEPGPSSGVMDIGNPASGNYTLQVVGTEDGAYNLEIRGYDKNFSRGKARQAKITNGEVHEYTFFYSNEPGSKITVGRKDQLSP